MKQLLAIALLAACGGRTEQLATEDLTVAKLPAATPVVPDNFDVPAVFTSTTSEVIPAPFSARIKRLDVHAGQLVHKGDPIATLDTAELIAKLSSARADERANRAEAGALAAVANAADKKLEAEERLFRYGAIAGLAVEETRKDYTATVSRQAAAVARAQSAGATRAELDRQLSLATITAPFSGVVADVPVHEGEVPAAGARIAQVVEPDHLIVRFAVPTGVKLATGQRVQVTSEDLEHPIWATVTRITRERAPISFTVVEAGIADTDRSYLQVASIGHVRIAYAPGAPR